MLWRQPPVGTSRRAAIRTATARRDEARGRARNDDRLLSRGIDDSAGTGYRLEHGSRGYAAGTVRVGVGPAGRIGLLHPWETNSDLYATCGTRHRTVAGMPATGATSARRRTGTCHRAQAGREAMLEQRRTMEPASDVMSSGGRR